MALILAHAGYMTSQARDGAEALASARARPPAAILMDIFMPIMDGVTATQHLSRDAALRHIPVIAQTAQPASLDNDRQLFFAILQKPSNPQKLLEALSRALAAARPSHYHRSALLTGAIGHASSSSGALEQLYVAGQFKRE
jgi:twitching motility two-component system response regulator PilH